MKRLTRLAAALTIAVSAAWGACASAAEASISSQSMQCFAMYSLMIDHDAPDDFQTKVLQNQAVLMGTIYVMNTGNGLVPVSNDQFQKSSDFATAALLQIARNDRKAFVQKLIDCEGWREEVLIDMALRAQQPAVNADMDTARQILSSIPKPRASYVLKGASIAQIEQVVDTALARHK